MPRILKCQDLVNKLEELYPSSLAEPWDRVGLHLGDLSSPINRVMTALDIRPNVVAEAIAHKVDTIIVHHPLIFQPIEHINYANPVGKMFCQIIQHQINIYVLHTNLDIQFNGMNDWLAEALELQQVESLEYTEESKHPSLGRIGQLSVPLDRDSVIQHIKKSLKAPQLSVIEATPKPFYQKIAIVGGSSFESIHAALDKAADIFITGDITYHKGHTALDFALMTVDPGHYIEQIFVHKMAQILNKYFENRIEVIPSQTQTNPFEYL